VYRLVDWKQMRTTKYVLTNRIAKYLLTFWTHNHTVWTQTAALPEKRHLWIKEKKWQNNVTHFNGVQISNYHRSRHLGQLWMLTSQSLVPPLGLAFQHGELSTTKQCRWKGFPREIWESCYRFKKNFSEARLELKNGSLTKACTRNQIQNTV